MNDWHSWAAVAVFAGTYALIISEKVHRVAAALDGAGLMLLIGATDDSSAFYSVDSGFDWNVFFLLINVPEHRPAADLDHRLRLQVRLLLDARAHAAGENRHLRQRDARLNPCRGLRCYRSHAPMLGACTPNLC